MNDVRTGEKVIRVPLGDTALAAYGYPYGVIYRVDLHDVFLDACKALPTVTLRTSSKVESFEQDGSGVRARLASGETLAGRRADRCRRLVEPHPRSRRRRRQAARVGPHRIPGRAQARRCAAAPLERRRAAMGWRKNPPRALPAAPRRTVQSGRRVPQQQVRRRLEHLRRHRRAERALFASCAAGAESCSARSRPGRCGCCATASR